VGDLFDAWIEYRTVIPKGFHRILAKLDELSAKGISIHFLAGNHDCWYRDYFQNEIGMKTYHEPFHITVDGKKIFIHHGDGLAKNDAGYRILKKIVRNKFSIWLFSWLHPDLGLKLARSSSKTSRGHSSNKHYGEEDGMLKFAREKIHEGFDYVIMGHRHVPIMKDFDHGTYINLGDWITHNRYAKLENGSLTLHEWK
ncbi:MAG: UDP-2,3-diacylglucosamine diphosphatase, partial [Ignavibacteriales bacterium]|nr:UDP-2,3-diacylglucosamine diphosphatase [Ignavibacteriales bacterium]